MMRLIKTVASDYAFTNNNTLNKNTKAHSVTLYALKASLLHQRQAERYGQERYLDGVNNRVRPLSMLRQPSV